MASMGTIIGELDCKKLEKSLKRMAKKACKAQKKITGRDRCEHCGCKK